MTQKTKPDVVLFCENNHYDPLVLLAEQNAYKSLNPNIWKHSLIEGTEPLQLEPGWTTLNLDVSGINPLKTSSFFSMSHTGNVLQNLNFYYLFSNIHMFLENKFHPHYFDSEEREALLDSINLCTKLKELSKEEDTSILYRKMKSISEVENPVNLARDKQIVTNLKDVIESINTGKTIAKIGRAHCVDLYHDLKNANSSMLDRITFLNMNSNYMDSMYMFKMVLEIYFFADCLEEYKASTISTRLKELGQLAEEMDEDEVEEARLEEEFINAPNTIDVNITISGEEGTIKPWNVAHLEVFS